MKILKDERGAVAIEFGLIAAVFFPLAIWAGTILGPKVLAWSVETAEVATEARELLAELESR